MIERLPNPHLRHYLDASVFDLSAKKFEKAVRSATLAAAHLPGEYDEGTPEQQRDARIAVLESWYDRAKPNELCSDVDNYIAAHWLWVEFYLKPDEYTGGRYHFRDSHVKYDILRAAMSPAKEPTEPAKTAIHAPRGTTKTVTLVHEAGSMIPIVRPYTIMLVMEINQERTVEELAVVRQTIEHNKLIQADFGGAGELYSQKARSGGKWKDSQLDFLRHPFCSLRGYSRQKPHRGRHPIFGVIDDPEDKKTLLNPKNNKELTDLILGELLGMFYPGSKLVTIANALAGSFAFRALQSIIDPTLDSEDLDEEFEDWNKVHFGMIQKDSKSGERFSIMRDHVSVEGYDVKTKTMGAAHVAAEYDGKPIGEGQFALIRDSYKHGYMHCLNDPRSPEFKPGLPAEYMLNLLTGTIVPWDHFLASLVIGGGCDLADSLSKRACLGANAMVGVNQERQKYVLDCVAKRQIADDWPETAMSMCIEWGAVRQAFDTNAMQKVVYRMAEQLRLDMEERGEVPPSLVPLRCQTMGKHLRVLATLRPLYRRHLIFFPRFQSVSTPDGLTHYPAPHPNERSFVELLRELDRYTDEGPPRPDDAADALQMAIEGLATMHGSPPEPVHENEEVFERWRKAGVDWQAVPHLVPEEAWTEQMRERAAEAMSPAETPRRRRRMDPYALCRV